jgi:hypothetical protein
MQSLAHEVLGITDPQNRPQSLEQAHYMLTGESFSRAMEALAYRSSKDKSQTERERLIDMRSVAEILSLEEIESANTLADWPTYTSLMDRYGTSAYGAASALMIGSLSSLSSRAFECLAERV